MGIFSRFSVSRAGHRRTQSAFDQREVILPPSTEATTTSIVAEATNGIEIAVEFKPVEHPTEPVDFDQPIQCPFPEPSILNDGRIWKETVSSGVQRKADVPVMRDQEQAPVPLPKPTRRLSNRVILPSISAPEHNMLKLLEECNVSGGI